MHIYKGMEWYGNYHTDGHIHVQSICMCLSHKQLKLRNANEPYGYRLSIQ